MHLKLKRVKLFLWVNNKISDFFFKWITIKDFRDESSYSITNLKPPFTFNVDLKNYSISATPYWKLFSNLRSSTLFYAKINQATIVSKGIVINKEKEVILESTIFQLEYLNILSSNHIVKFQKLLPTSSEDKVFSLLNKLDNNYYHWTLESLTRLLLVHDLPFFKDYKVVIKHKPLPFIKASLQFLFNLNENQIIEKPLYKRIKAKEALIVSFPHIRNETTQNTNTYYPFIIQQLNELANRRLLERKIKFNTPKNIIISRKNATERKIINEATLEESLQSYNFKCISLESLSFIEQVTLFANANIVIATHGAGIANIIYSKKALLIELFPKQRNIRDAYYFAQITGALGLEHHALLYEEETYTQNVFITKSMLRKIDKILKTFNN